VYPVDAARKKIMKDATQSDGPRTITPFLPANVLEKLKAYIEVKRNLGDRGLAKSLRGLNDLWKSEEWSLELRAAALIIADLVDQGWIIELHQAGLQLQPPGLRLHDESVSQAKQRIQRGLHATRDRQLSEPSVKRFIEQMTVPKRHLVGLTSIRDLVDNGGQLVELVRKSESRDDEGRMTALRELFDPVVEACDSDARCDQTGLNLGEIWRYFRHTWSSEYRSIPGRQIPLLIRNAARPKKPVIGIAMLASPVMQLGVRDNWIGWTARAYFEALKEFRFDPKIALRALATRLEQSLSEVRWDDLASPEEIAFPRLSTILRLEQRSAGAKSARQRQLEKAYEAAAEANEPVRSDRDLRSNESDTSDWKSKSSDFLFVAKRAALLAKLLESKRFFQTIPWESTSDVIVDKILKDKNAETAVTTAVTELRKAGLASQVVDISVCGAVAPYSHFLGGKLVALLMMSSEVREIYRSRYSTQVSLISSQMAGRSIYRPAELKVLTTTSLYGSGSSQYNRLSLSASRFPELKHDLSWRELAKTAGFGTIHLGADTFNILREVSEKAHGARRVNNRFGEGTSPRLRQLRMAIDSLGMNSGAVLNHSTPRIVYGCEIHPGAISELLGINPLTKDYGHSIQTIAELWRRRWLRGRVSNQEVLDAASKDGPDSYGQFFRTVCGLDSHPSTNFPF